MAPIIPRVAAFDPYNQYLNLTMPDGVTRESFNISEIFFLQHLATVSAVMFGCQVGISGIMVLIISIMTKPDKRRSVVFILNIAALLFVFVRSILMCVEVTSALYNFYNYMTGYYLTVTGDLRVSVAAEVLSTLAIVFIELSMMFQTRIVCCTLPDIWRRVIDVFSVIVVLGVVAMRFTLCILNSDWNIIHVQTETEQQFHTLDRIASATNIVVACSIIFFSSIFCAKLGHAILERRKLGMKQFGPMQIIFVMGCQTLVIPAIFGILAYIVLKSTQINTFMPVIVATFLPLSSMWASTNTGNKKIAAPHHIQGHRNIPVGRSDLYDSGTASTEKQLLNSTANTGNTLVNDTNNSHKNTSPNKFGDATSVGGRDSVEAEMKKIGQNIHMDRTYSVQED